MTHIPSSYGSYHDSGEISLEIPVDVSLITGVPVDFIILLNMGMACIAIEAMTTSADMRYDQEVLRPGKRAGRYGYHDFDTYNSSVRMGMYTSVLSLRGSMREISTIKG